MKKTQIVDRRQALVVCLFAVTSCTHAVPQTAPPPPKPATTVQTIPAGVDIPEPQTTPIGSWAGVVKAVNDRTATLMAPMLNVAVTITKAGPNYEGDCSQSGSTDVVKTIDREVIENFRLIGIDPAGSIVLMEGHCGKLRFTLAYHPLYDRITGVDWADHHFMGEMTRQFPIDAPRRQSSASMANDVRKMVRAALKLNQPMPWAGVIPEVDVVARHGKAVVPQLLRLLPDDPTDPNDPRLVYDHADERLIIWGRQFEQCVEQQAAMALCKIYEATLSKTWPVPLANCPMYHVRALPEQNRKVRPFWLKIVAENP